MPNFDQQSWCRRSFLKFLAGSPLLAYSGFAARSAENPGLPSGSEAMRTQSGTISGERVILGPDDAIDVFDFEVAARRVLPPAHYDYIAWGANNGATTQANREGFTRYALRPRRLVDVTQIDTSTELFGVKWKVPIILAPTGSEKAFHPEGAIAAARAARSRGQLQILSTNSTSSIEDVTAASAGPVWFQLYPTQRWNITLALLKRAEATGCPAVVVTVDMPPSPLLRNMRRLGKYTDTRRCADCHGTGAQDYAARKPMFDGLDLTGLSTLMAPNLTWDVVRRIRDSTRMKVLLKGIQTKEDAMLCVENGVDGIIVSNHGGRTEGSSRATIACLPEVVAAAGGRLPVLVDGGFRRGTDIYKALALGANGICIGRPYLWGLASFGQPGVEGVHDLLREELELVMRQCGTRSLREITPAQLYGTSSRS